MDAKTRRGYTRLPDITQALQYMLNNGIVRRRHACQGFFTSVIMTGADSLADGTRVVVARIYGARLLENTDCNTSRAALSLLRNSLEHDPFWPYENLEQVLLRFALLTFEISSESRVFEYN